MKHNYWRGKGGAGAPGGTISRAGGTISKVVDYKLIFESSFNSSSFCTKSPKNMCMWLWNKELMFPNQKRHFFVFRAHNFVLFF